jgi:hypothetical protein
MARVLGRPVTLEEVAPAYAAEFEALYDLRLSSVTWGDLIARVAAGRAVPAGS